MYNVVAIKAGSFDGLKKLRNLRLGNNRLSIIDANAFYGLKNLHELELSANKLTRLEIDTFKGLESLVELWLDNNELCIIDPDLFCHLQKSIKLISLVANQITYRSFVGNKYLENRACYSKQEEQILNEPHESKDFQNFLKGILEIGVLM